MPQSFGQFSPGPDGRFVSGAPRPKFRLLAAFGFKDPHGKVWEVPAGVEVDGASIPRAFWSVIGGPFDGNYLNASVVHDHYCRVRSRSAQDTHRAFYYGMRAAGVSEPQAKKMFWAVSTFGPKWELVRRRGGVGEDEEVAVPAPEIDLDDAATRARAEERFREVSEVLEESGGERMPGEPDASLESIEADAERFRSSLGGGRP
jgi:hypothetical protein